MAVSYQKTLYRGSSYTRGIQNKRDTRSVLVDVIEGLDDNVDMLKEAVDEAVEYHGTVHPSNSALPARRARATWFGNNRAAVEVEYDGRPNVMAGTTTLWGEVDATRVIRVYTYAAAGATWGTTGGANNEATTSDVNLVWDKQSGTSIIKPRVVEQTLTTIRLNTDQVLESPLESTAVMFMRNKTNGTAFTVSNHLWAENELRFDGFRQRNVVYDVGATNASFLITYQYTVMSGGWYTDQNITTDNIVYRYNMYEQTNFTDVPME